MILLMMPQEKISFYSHFIGALAGLAGTVHLLTVAYPSVLKMVLAGIYGLTMVLLFSASSLYHAFKEDENSDTFWRKLDHTAIFFMIAGTYTPVSYVYLTGYWRWSIIFLQWFLVLLGFFFKFFYIKAPRYLSTVIYLIMGWIGLISIKGFLTTMPGPALFYLLAGGVSFTIGAVFYALKKPKLLPGFGFHEIFHLFILLGAVFHYLLVYMAITSN